MTAQPLKIIFAGTPEFAAVALQALIQSEHTIQAVYTQPDRPAGRGRQVTQSAVKQLALKHNLPVYQPLSLRDAAAQEELASIKADIMVVVAYGLILPLRVLQIPKLGCINIHASLLPHWRGAAPIQRAILEGDQQTGVTIMQMDEGLDTGPMLHQVHCPIKTTDTSETLHNRLAELGAEAVLTVLRQLSEGKIDSIPQKGSQASYAHKITKDEAHIDWSKSAEAIHRQIRAFQPWPVAVTSMGEMSLRIWHAEVQNTESTKNAPGTIVELSSEGIDIATGKGILRLLQIQKPGSRVLPVKDFLNAKPEGFVVGSTLSEKNDEY